MSEMSNLKQLIEQKRAELYKATSSAALNYSSTEIVDLSQDLDKLINQYMILSVSSTELVNDMRQPLSL